ncbi:MAG: Cation/acetate symporter ActP, partial [Verrucomicrobiota bacterium]
MHIDYYILAFSAITVVVTIWMGFRSAKTSKTASDFFVAGRSVSVGWNASAISGEYLSAASFMGIAGMVMSSGYDALWYPVCYACGYLFLLLFIAGPLRRFGAYTIPDFAEGRFDSPLFRKIAVCFVLFIGFFYTMPQMKGAGTTLAYIFPGLPYWAGVVLVGAVITLNVALGGMKGITLVQAFQYWAKMFAISVPIFVLMAVYGHYGKQLDSNGNTTQPTVSENVWKVFKVKSEASSLFLDAKFSAQTPTNATVSVEGWLVNCALVTGKTYLLAKELGGGVFARCEQSEALAGQKWVDNVEKNLRDFGVITGDFMMVGGVTRTNASEVVYVGGNSVAIFPSSTRAKHLASLGLSDRKPLPEKAPADSTWLSPFGPLTTKAAKAAKLSAEESKPYSLLYTYSLIIALVCGTAGLPHILVRFYTNPDGVAAKRTTMWVMILIGVFYVFPPVFGAIGRNLMPELYAGVGAKGTDKVVLELPTLLGANTGVLGSVLSGITCAGAFAAFMSTFSGLLVSMTGALAHDVYGRILRPQSKPQERMVAFKVAAVLVGGVAIGLGCFVEPLEINF